MTDEEDESIEQIGTAQCGACQAEIPADSKSCPECKVSFSGLEDVDMGECGSCQAIVPLDSKACPSCNISFVLDDLINSLKEWMTEEQLSISDVFGKWDANDDGVLSGGEIRAGLLEAELAVLPISEVDRFMHQVDLNNDSEISFAELSALLSLPEIIDVDDAEEISEDGETSENDEDESENDEEEADADSDDDDSDDDEDSDDDSDDEDSDEAEDDDSDDDDSDDDSDDEDADSDDDDEQLIDKLVDLVRDADENIRSVFTEFDDNNNNLISPEEFKKSIEKHFDDDFDDGEIDELIDAIDTDEDGFIDLIEFVDSIESPDDVKETIEEKKSEGPTKNQIWLMRNEENLFPILWSIFGLGAIMVVVNVFGFFANVFTCKEGDNAWLLNNDWCASNTKLNLLDIFSSSDPSSWSPSGSWGIPDIFAILLCIGLIIGSIYFRKEVKSWKEQYRKKKASEEDEDSSDDDSEEESDEDADDETEDESDEEESDEDGGDEEESDESDDDDDEDDSDESDEEIDVGSHVGVEHEGEEWYGVIVKFDEDDDEVLVKDDDSGDEYWIPFDAMFVD